jgi:hypothetical protein
MRKWLVTVVWVAVTFFAGLAMLFMLLVLGVQYGDTYKGQDQPSFVAAAKYVVLKALHEIKNGIYHEATIHNPSGDTIPDSWDDSLIHKIKQVF